MKSEKIQFLTAYIDSLQSHGRYYFEREQAIRVLDKSQAAFDIALHRLIKKGRVGRIRGDFYVIIPLEYSAIGSLPATWFIDPFMRFMQIEYYVGLLSAAEQYGATHQQVMTFQVIANKVMRPIRLGQVTIDFHYQKHVPTDFLRSIKTETGEMLVASPEVVVCDLIKYVNAVGQIHNVATVLCELQEGLSMEALLRYIKSFSIGTVYIQRLGYLLDYLNLDISTQPLQQWLSQKKLEYRPLVMGSTSAIIEKNKRWHILVNEAVETDL